MVKVVKRNPAILRYDVEAKLEPHVEWLEREGLTNRASITRVISRSPHVRNGNSISCFSIKTRAMYFNIVSGTG